MLYSPGVGSTNADLICFQMAAAKQVLKFGPAIKEVNIPSNVISDHLTSR